MYMIYIILTEINPKFMLTFWFFKQKNSNNEWFLKQYTGNTIPDIKYYENKIYQINFNIDYTKHIV